MLKIIDVDFIDNFRLALAFNDGFEGIVDLEELFSKSPFEQLAQQFLNFSLTQDTLCWGDMHVSPNYLRDIAIAQPTDNVYIDPNNPLEVITKAFQDSLIEDDPTILQAALRGYADKLGMSNLVQNAGVKSRTSAYKSLSQQGSPKWETIVKLAHSVISLENEAPHSI